MSSSPKSANASSVHDRLPDVPIENFRPFKVIVIGAGFSGINCAIRIPERLRSVDLVVYEKNSEVGGTWLENKYPGCACDVPAHSYQYSYAPNPRWSSFYAPSNEIHAYLKSVCDRFSASRFIRLNHRVEACRWNETTAQWHVNVRNTLTNEMFQDIGHAVISARGTLNDIQWPDIKGLEDFSGVLMHSAAWDASYDFHSKTVGVIGGGSSAVQIVPALQKVPGVRLKCFVRSKTWISQPFGAASMGKLGITDVHFSEERKNEFASNRQKYHDFRKTIEQEGNAVHFLTFRDSEMQAEARRKFEIEMKRRLSRKPEIAESLIPSFAVGCRRLTPGEGYLEALTESNVDFVSQAIREIRPEGIIMEDGQLIQLDALVCATGFRAAKSPPFPILGVGGVDMATRFEPFPETYMAMLMDGYPNFFSILGPNSLIGTGSLTMILESQADYIIKCIRKLQRENIRIMSVKRERVVEFSNYVDKYFEQSVFLDGCTSWYRNQGGRGPRITGLWPGSTLHAIEALRSPRWEDFDYEYNHQEEGIRSTGQLSWLGNGWTEPQRGGRGDLAFYLEPEYLDVPAEPFPEETHMYQLRSYCY